MAIVFKVQCSVERRATYLDEMAIIFKGRGIGDFRRASVANSKTKFAIHSEFSSPALTTVRTVRHSKTLFQFGGIRFLEETVYNILKTVLIRN
jgi:hypothetical protein